MQDVVHIETLPDGALDAASEFALRWLPKLRERIGQHGSIVIILPPADIDHTDWRRAVIRDFARASAPMRVNLIGGGTDRARAATLAYLEGAAGVTGQYLPLTDEST